MADFTLNLTGTAQVDNSIVLAYDQGFIVAAGQAAILDQFVQTRYDIGAKSIAFPKYGRLAVSTTPLNEREDLTSAALADTEVLFTPAEYGNVVTTTSLASLQTGGKVDLAAATLVGLNMGQTMDALAIAALKTSTNITVDATFDGAALDAQYSRLAAKSVQPLADGLYVAVMPESKIALLRAESGWIDVQKYSNALNVLRNEVGIYKGHRIVRHQGVGTDVISFGYNAFGKAVSKEASLTMTGPFDKLGRMVNVGWYGVLAYGLIDTDSVERITIA